MPSFNITIFVLFIFTVALGYMDMTFSMYLVRSITTLIFRPLL